jgi:hypothetical protein
MDMVGCCSVRVDTAERRLRQRGRSKDSPFYQQWGGFGSPSYMNIWVMGICGQDLAKPFGEMTILVFELGNNPPATSSKG